MHEKNRVTGGLCERIQRLAAGRDFESEGEPSTGTGAGPLDLIEIVGKTLRPQIEAANRMSGRLLSGPLNEVQRLEAEALAGSVRRMLGALSEVLDLHQLAAGEAVLAVDRFDLHGLVKDIATPLQIRAAEKGLATSVEVAADCPQFIVGDEKRVRQVVTALCESALQSTSEGSIRLYVSANTSSSPATVRFDVTDTSQGLSAAEQISLFQPSADTERSDGGLGLPLARRTAEAMGGTADCDSAKGQGTLYWFTFLAAVAEDGRQGETDADTETPEPANGIGRDGGGEAKRASENEFCGHVLVVEHNAVNRLLICSYLEEFGLSCECAETGTTALMCLTARPYDLVLMDTTLPDYDGLQMAERIRTLQVPSSQVPVVALTTQSDAGDGRSFVEAGINACVARPIRGQALYAALVPFLSANERKADIAKAS